MECTQTLSILYPKDVRINLLGAATTRLVDVVLVLVLVLGLVSRSFALQVRAEGRQPTGRLWAFETETSSCR
jgi:hypothetical protein